MLERGISYAFAQILYTACKALYDFTRRFIYELTSGYFNNFVAN